MDIDISFTDRQQYRLDWIVATKEINFMDLRYFVNKILWILVTHENMKLKHLYVAIWYMVYLKSIQLLTL